MTEFAQTPNDHSLERQPIEAHRRLISAAESYRSGVREYADNTAGKRLMSIPSESEQSQIHNKLSRYGVPVFPVIATDDRNLLLEIPSDARTIQKSLRFIARDPEHYSEIFHEIGIVLGRCALARVGLPVADNERTMLGGIAFSASSDQPLGSAIYLLPPYNLDKTVTKHDEMALLRSELVSSPDVTPVIANSLIYATSSGWEHVRS